MDPTAWHQKYLNLFQHTVHLIQLSLYHQFHCRQCYLLIFAICSSLFSSVRPPTYNDSEASLSTISQSSQSFLLNVLCNMMAISSQMFTFQLPKSNSESDVPWRVNSQKGSSTSQCAQSKFFLGIAGQSRLATSWLTVSPADPAQSLWKQKSPVVTTSDPKMFATQIVFFSSNHNDACDFEKRTKFRK